MARKKRKVKTSSNYKKKKVPKKKNSVKKSKPKLKKIPVKRKITKRKLKVKKTKPEVKSKKSKKEIKITPLSKLKNSKEDIKNIEINPKVSNSLTLNDQIKNKKLQKAKIIPITPKKDEKKVIEKKSYIKQFLLILSLIIGGVASYLFRDIIVYSISGLVVLLLLFLILKSKKKCKPQPIVKNKKLPEKKIYLTQFDKFYNHILEKGSVSISKLSKHFNIPKKQVEEWAKILEGRGLISIYYPLIGEPELRCPN